jgi:hypothetical protein
MQHRANEVHVLGLQALLSLFKLKETNVFARKNIGKQLIEFFKTQLIELSSRFQAEFVETLKVSKVLLRVIAHFSYSEFNQEIDN